MDFLRSDNYTRIDLVTITTPIRKLNLRDRGTFNMYIRSFVLGDKYENIRLVISRWYHIFRLWFLWL